MAEDLEKILHKYNLNEKELHKLLKDTKKQKPTQYNKVKLPIDEKRIKFTVISDSHIGHKEYRPQILEHAILLSKKEGSEFFLHCGDIIEGMSGREGHIYELSHIGATNQMEYAVQQLSKIEVPIYAITSTNSHDGWYSSKNNMGFEIGYELDNKIDNFTFLGYDEVDIELDNKLKLRMIHPGDGTAYAISYKMQKYINALTGGHKPNILFQGHYHKALQMFYRNIHAFDAGCLQAQTIFMKKKQTPAMTGYWLIDVATDKKGSVSRLKSEFIPFYD